MKSSTLCCWLIVAILCLAPGKIFGESNIAPIQLKIINNTEEHINVIIYALGASCEDNCLGDAFETESIKISPGTITFDVFQDFFYMNPQIDLGGGPNSDCYPNLCTGIEVQQECGYPVWQSIGFSYPGGNACCVWRVGNISCGLNEIFSEPGLTVKWIVVSTNLIKVEFY